MAGFDSHVPPAIPAQLLLGLVLAAFPGWIGVTVSFPMSWPVRG